MRRGLKACQEIDDNMKILPFNSKLPIQFAPQMKIMSYCCMRLYNKFLKLYHRAYRELYRELN